MTHAMRMAWAISIFVHLVAFSMMSRSIQLPNTTPSTHVTVTVTSDALALSATDTDTVVGLSVGESREVYEAQKARRLAYQQYRDQLDVAIHEARFSTGHFDLIGIVLLSYTIDSAGMVSDISVEKSSGDDQLDKAASAAVASISGKLKRPPILGTDPWRIFTEVRYQYDLR